jgi:hypothetical protein
VDKAKGEEEVSRGNRGKEREREKREGEKKE